RAVTAWPAVGKRRGRALTKRPSWQITRIVGYRASSGSEQADPGVLRHVLVRRPGRTVRDGQHGSVVREAEGAVGPEVDEAAVAPRRHEVVEARLQRGLRRGPEVDAQRHRAAAGRPEERLADARARQGVAGVAPGPGPGHRR